MPEILPFYGVIERVFRGKKLYRFHASEHMLTAIWMGGALSNPFELELINQLAFGLLTPWIRLLDKRLQTRERTFDEIDVFADEILSLDKRHMQLTRHDISEMRLKRQAWLMPIQFGTLHMRFVNGDRLKFMLPGVQHPEAIEAALMLFFPAMNVEGSFIPPSEGN